MKKPAVIKKKSSPLPGLEGVRRVGEIKRARSWCFYGRSGSGKTTLAASFPKPILLLDVRDQGTDSVSDVEGMFEKQILSLDDFDDAYYYLKENPSEIKTVIIDTVSQLQQLCIEEIVASSRKKNGRAAGDWGSMTRRQFGDVAAQLKELTLNFRNLTDEGIEVVFIAQERTNKIDDDGSDEDNQLTPEVGPQLMPSIAQHLNANVSCIINTFIRVKTKKVQRGNKTREEQLAVYCQRVGPNPIYITKLRKPKGVEAPPFIENGVYEDLVEVIEGK